VFDLKPVHRYRVSCASLSLISPSFFVTPPTFFALGDSTLPLPRAHETSPRYEPDLASPPWGGVLVPFSPSIVGTISSGFLGFHYLSPLRLQIKMALSPKFRARACPPFPLAPDPPFGFSLFPRHLLDESLKKLIYELLSPPYERLRCHSLFFW